MTEATRVVQNEDNHDLREDGRGGEMVPYDGGAEKACALHSYEREERTMLQTPQVLEAGDWRSCKENVVSISMLMTMNQINAK
jgi:hypothetical protein